MHVLTAVPGPTFLQREGLSPGKDTAEAEWQEVLV